jgi:hypothetical protein
MIYGSTFIANFAKETTVSGHGRTERVSELGHTSEVDFRYYFAALSDISAFGQKPTSTANAQCSLFHKQQTFDETATWGFVFNPTFLRMNQAHRSGSSSRQRIDHPLPEGLTAGLACLK